MAKLIIQIPCYNEEATLAATVADLPRSIEGIDTIELQVIDDGSTDRTVEVAQSLGVKHIISFKNNRGLAMAFKQGVDNALRAGADILVNTDADNQYFGADVTKLVQPILRGKADMIIGTRPIPDHPEFSWLKKKLQIIGSAIVSRLAGVDVSDATSGFRAYSRDAMLRLNIFSDFSYTLETIIQSGLHNVKVATVPIRVNGKVRESRLARGIAHFVWRSFRTIIKLFIIYRSGAFFTVVSGLTFLLFLLLFSRYLIIIFWLGGPYTRFWPSIVIAGALLVLSVQLYLTGIICALMHSNRVLDEEVLYRLRKLDMIAPPSPPE